jgi:RecB family exonuclease
VPASAQERNLASLDAWVSAGRPVLDHPLAARSRALAGGLVAVMARRSHGFTAYDGRISRPPALDEAISPTALEMWAECPQRYFLAQVLRVDATDVPEDVLEPDGRSRGGLVHEVLEQLVRQRGLGRPPDEPWSEHDRAWAADLAGRLHDDLIVQGRASTSVLGEVRWAELLQRLDQALTLDDRRREEQRLVPEDVEVDFGPGREWGDVVLRTQGGRRVGFRGRIDRVDVSEDGDRVVVVDYKTGKQKKLVEAAAAGNPTRLLQLPVYALAARANRPGAAVEVESAYWLVDRDDDRALLANPLSDEQFEGVVDAVAGGIEAGVFPATPGEDRGHEWANCRYCPFDRLCPADRGHALSRKYDADALEPLRALEAIVSPQAGPA